MKIWAYIIWVISVVMWIITIILGNISSKKEKQVDSGTFYSYLIIVFVLFMMVGAVLISLWR